MNRITIIGNLTKDPELRHTKDGIPVCSFTVAVNRKPTQAQRENNQRPEADFFNVTAWRNRGEVCAKFLTKGSKVCVVGSVSLRTWDTGEKHGANMEVLAEEVEFLNQRISDEPNRDASGMEIVYTDELPFE